MVSFRGKCLAKVTKRAKKSEIEVCGEVVLRIAKMF